MITLNVTFRRALISLAAVLVLTHAVLADDERPASDASAELHALFDTVLEFQIQEDPMLATWMGLEGHNDRLGSMAIADLKRRADAMAGYLEALHAIDREALDETDRVSYEIFERDLRGVVDEFELGHHRLLLTADEGFHIGFGRLPNETPLRNAKDYDDYIARLHAFPAYAAQHIALLRDGLEHGMTLPRAVLDGYEGPFAAQVVDDPTQSLFWKPFENFPDTLPETERERLRVAGKAAIMDGVVPGYRAALEFMVEEYIPGARTELGATQMPNGAAYYAQRIRHFTTLDLTAQEIHDIGLAEVARIRAEMEAIIEDVEFEGSFDEFLHFLRTDPQFYAETPEELLKEASYIAKQMDAKLPALFETLPRMPYGVTPVPDHIAPKYTAGRYVSSNPGSTQPGYYWVNTHKLESRPLYALPALTLHEAVPGHHLQIALNQELEDLPLFRRFSYISAFGEGWGLYAEWLGVEAGIYKDPYSDFGRLTYEMWRACRLVVDTGLHAMGWTRQQALDYLASNTALSLHEVTTETDRYISWPGQALAYKLGELEIKQLRREAEATLGEHFDVRKFHDVVLGNGSVPLSVLRGVVERWIARTAAQHGAPKDASSAQPSAGDDR